MRKLLKNKKGITLIELMIAIGIISIMFTAFIVSFRGGKTEKELEIAAREVSAAIREAQNNALTGKNAKECGGCEGIYFRFNGAWTGVGRDEEEACIDCPLSENLLKNRVFFSAAGKFYFSIPFGEIKPVDPPNWETGDFISIELLKGSSRYYVCVTKSGNVYEQKTECP